MSFASLMSQPLTLIPVSEGTVDAYNNPSTTEGSPVAFNGRIDQSSTTELVDGREATVTRFTLFAPADLPVTRTDRITGDGRTYAVDGEPSMVRGRAGAVHHLEVPLRVLAAG